MARSKAAGAGAVGSIVALVVVIYVATALIPGVASNVQTLTSGATASVTGASATLLGNIILFIALGLMLLAVGFGLSYLGKIHAVRLTYSNMPRPIKMLIVSPLYIQHR